MNGIRLAWILTAAGLLAGGLALFGPSERWGGVDLGAIGANAFVLCLLAAIWLFSRKSQEIFPDHMSLTERRAWVGLVFLVIILATFTGEMLGLSRHAVVPESIHDLFTQRFIQRYVLLIIAWAVVSHLIGRRAGGIEVDERDLQLRHRAGRAADWALTLIVIGGIVVLASVPRQQMSWWLAPIVLANLLIGLLIAKSLVEHVALAIAYRSSGPANA